ncbi:MAG TPA: hypothetical protein VGO50_11590 [Pyrinomonadaceae bacterium]|nr:hypothetical protein [Pyrinomonadaceae bacterium]
MKGENKLRELKRRYSSLLLSQKDIYGVGIEKDESGNAVLAIHIGDISPESLDLPEDLKAAPLKYIRQGKGFKAFKAKDEY